MEFGVLGPVEVTASGRPLAMGGARARAVLAVLLAHAGTVVPADRLTDELWPGQPADRAAASLQVRLSELRKGFRLAGEAGRLATRPPGYLLPVTPAELDSLRFAAARRRRERGAGRRGGGHRGAEARSGSVSVARARLRRSRRAVRAGGGWPLEEMRLAALESRTEALLECGRHRELVAELEALSTAHPLRERLWSARMLALYRAGRQADSLHAYRDLRAILAGELGIEPGPPLRDLHARILRQDPGLDRPAGRPPPAPQTRYVQSADGVYIAYQVLGHGDRDIVFVPGLMSHLELLWEDPETAGFFHRLATLGRLILFDKRDTGLSDRAPGDATLEQRMDDVRAVMGAAESARAVNNT